MRKYLAVYTPKCVELKTYFIEVKMAGINGVLNFNWF